MLFIENSSLNPWFNIALEEYLLKHLDQELVMLWRSKPSVIVGKHQNTLAEINLPFVMKHQIPVVRRLSGGGTVFHDPGNINFTFIRKAQKEKLVDFRSHTQPVIDFLQQLGVDARFEGKNDLRVSGLKISGNAEHVYKDKVLHHGTLLFDADLSWLNEAIKAKEELFESKAIKSVRSKVANISTFLAEPMQREQFIKNLKTHFFNHFTHLQPYLPGPDDIRAVNRLMDEKYTQWHWNYGWSPVYTFRNQTILNNSEYALEITVAKGLIQKVFMLLDGKALDADHPLLVGLKNMPHHPDEVSALLVSLNFSGYNQLDDHWQLLGLFF